MAAQDTEQLVRALSDLGDAVSEGLVYVGKGLVFSEPSHVPGAITLPDAVAQVSHSLDSMGVLPDMDGVERGLESVASALENVAEAINAVA